MRGFIGPYKLLGFKSIDGRRYLSVECRYCGMRKTVQRANALRSKSCGCRTRQILHDARTIHGHAKNWGQESKTYKAWRLMLQRCYNNNHKSYANYGGRGIAVDIRWHRFANFLNDMGIKPIGMTLGRINNNESYSNANCGWQSFKEQANNRRNNHILGFRNHKLTVSQWSSKTGLSQDTILKRLKRNWSIRKVLTTAVRTQRNNASTFLAKTTKRT